LYPLDVDHVDNAFLLDDHDLHAQIDDDKQDQLPFDKHNIDQSHELLVDNSFPTLLDDVVHLELATMCRDGNFPLTTFDKILR
jgi:hypothetical protein